MFKLCDVINNPIGAIKQKTMGQGLETKKLMYLEKYIMEFLTILEKLLK